MGVGWAPAVRAELEALLLAGAGRGWPVAFDFDNSIVCGDIGEATLARLAQRGFLAPAKLPPAAARRLTLADGTRLEPGDCADVTEYYERLLEPSSQGAADPAPLATGYVWAVEAMAGMTVTQVIATTALVSADAHPCEERFIEVTPGRPGYPVPWFYEEIAELIAMLVEHEFDVWIVSASNVWSVRWMVQYGLNGALSLFGTRRRIKPDHIIGVTTLLEDPEGRWLKDRVLVKQDRAYARLRHETTRGLRLTGHLEFPVPVYSGKVAALWDAIGRRPCLAVGDSPGDHAMLSFSERRLWIARLEKPDYQEATRALIRRTGRQGWMVQPTLCKGSPGLVSNLDAVSARLGEVPPKVARSCALLKGWF